jgi:hypothetical protein
VLRAFELSDFPIYQGWFSDPETRRWVADTDAFCDSEHRQKRIGSPGAKEQQQEILCILKKHGAT